MRLVLAILLMFAVAVRGQQTPAQILEAGKAFNALSDQQINVAQVTLLSYMLYGQAISPSTILAQGSAFQALSDQQLQICIATLLNQWQAAGISGSSLTYITKPPQIGVTQTLPGYNPQANSPGFMFLPANTRAIVKDVYFVPDISGNQFLNTTNGTNVHYRVYVDNGDQTNNVFLAGTGTNFMAIDVPLANLFGDKFRFTTNGPYNVMRDSSYLYTQDTSSNAYFRSYVKNADIKLPMYCTNGMVICLFDTFNNVVWQHGYMQASYQTGLLSAPFTTQRLRTAAFYGNPPSGTNTLISRAGGPGVIVGMLLSTHSTNGLDWTDTVEPVFQVSSNKTWIWSGYSDFFKDPYSMANGFNTFRDHGTIHAWIQSNDNDTPGLQVFTQTAFEVYRWWDDDPIYFDSSSGLQVIGWGLLSEVIQDMVLWYYAP